MTTTTIEMYGDVAPVDVLSGGAVMCAAGASVLPVWRPRVTEGGFAPITAPIANKHNSTRVSVPGCRGTT
ncbi:hypothetical protein [Pseudonocardia sp. KRD291]|uniref:hypothetical protein n=1 Tax=Pseudonocardia sp. KRD291 TaxID=2792007 RepID=UPI001C4A4959|nr:hypothetical protein [Pseudonocardia sp. KRD291]MBW0107137.1 hypothetical protein [Pseudonocardia sp. KRD291]